MDKCNKNKINVQIRVFQRNIKICPNNIQNIMEYRHRLSTKCVMSRV